MHSHRSNELFRQNRKLSLEFRALGADTYCMEATTTPTTTPTRGRSGGDARGNAADRRARKANLMRHFGAFATVADTVPCAWCGDALAVESVEADRIVTGNDGGKYRMVNLIPACRHCNASRADQTVDEYSPKCGTPTLAAAMIAHAATYRPRR